MLSYGRLVECGFGGCISTQALAALDQTDLGCLGYRGCAVTCLSTEHLLLP